jgi:DNA polymerase V
LFELQQWASIAFERIFRKNVEYKKAGVILDNLIPREAVTSRLNEQINEKHDQLIKAIDAVSRKFGRETLRLAVAHQGKWQTKSKRRSPRYMTRVEEIIKIL